MTPDIPKAKFSCLIEPAENGEEVVIPGSERLVARFEPTQASLRTFLDTNVLLYADDLAYPAKQQRALELILGTERGVQVFYLCK